MKFANRIFQMRKTQTEDAGQRALACGCPVGCATGSECRGVRTGPRDANLGCLCPCHQDDKSISMRTYLSAYFYNGPVN